MRKCSFVKSVLSVILCLSLVFSFATAFAVSTAAAGGSYTWRVRVEVLNNFDSTSDGDTKKSYLTIKGGELNGTEAASIVIDQKKIEKDVITDYDDGTSVYLTNLFSNSDIGASTSVTTYTTTYFPTYFLMHMYKTGHAGFGIADYTTHLEVRNSSGTWIDLCSANARKGSGWGDMETSASVSADKMPVASSVKFTKNPQTSLTVPRTDQQMVTSEFATAVYDQYGVVWYDAATVAFTDYHEGITVGNGEISISSDANSADGSNTALTLCATYLTLQDSVNITLTNASYNYQFEDIAGTVIKQGSLKYGQNIPKPANPTKASDQTNHYVFDKWDKWDNSLSNLQITKDITFKPEFKAVEHVFENYQSNGDATCTADGTKTGKCSCGYENTLTDTDSALGHSYTSAVTTAPTCTEPGEMTYTCIRGDHSYVEPIEAEGHNYEAATVAATCTTEGYVLHTCSKCQDFYTSDTVAALGHGWDEGTITTEPTCTETGVKTFECSRCDAQRTEEVAALGHNVSNWTTESLPTCTQDGARYGTCTRTGCKLRVDEVIPATGHDWSEWDIDTPVSCETDGEEVRFCSICAAIDTNSIPAIGHHFDEDNPTIELPSDGKEGRIYYRCLNGCGKCAYCVLDESGNKAVGEVATPSEMQSSENDIIPTATFNDYTRQEIGYSYGLRGASLRVDKNADRDLQALRFTASVLLPEGARILDFGMISTDDASIAGKPKKFAIGKDAVDTFSVKNGGKYSSFQTNEGTVFTFNVVYLIHRNNWGDSRYVKPYIVYSFMGQEFTVYDSLVTDRSVNQVAKSAWQSPNESKFIKNYIVEKGLYVPE